MYMSLFVEKVSFLFNATPTTEFYTHSLHDALPIFPRRPRPRPDAHPQRADDRGRGRVPVREGDRPARSEEHTSELQSRPHLVCRLLLEKKKQIHRLRLKLNGHTASHLAPATMITTR